MTRIEEINDRIQELEAAIDAQEDENDQLEDECDSIDLQIDTHGQGPDADRDWLIRAKHARRCKSRDIQRGKREAGALRRELTRLQGEARRAIAAKNAEEREQRITERKQNIRHVFMQVCRREIGDAEFERIFELAQAEVAVYAEAA